jgi:RsiW-degrading membrane proteinase PrsW (M82 family)
MEHDSNDRAAARRQAVLWFALLMFVGSSMSFGAIWAFRYLPIAIGFDMSEKIEPWQIPIFLVVSIFLMGALVYAGSVAWLLFARCFFSRADVAPIVFRGPRVPWLSAFDGWLFNVIFPVPPEQRGLTTGSTATRRKRRAR